MNFDLEDPTAEMAEETFALSKIEQVQIDFKRYEKNLAEMASNAGTHLINDTATNEQAVVMAGQAKAMFKAIEKKRKEVIAPASEFVAAVNQLVKPLTGILTGIETGLKQRITRYDQEQTLKRLEAQRKANEDADRLQKEIDAAAKESGETPAIVVQSVALDVPKITRTSSGSSSQRTTWAFEVEDFAALPDKFKQIDRVALNAEVKAGIRQIPGVRIYQEQSTQIRSASIPKWDDNEKF